ncbi:CopD family protein (plasmid) [Pseudonocardia sp. DSM 110487]|uniref:CopD family protein n=1 Tax=Pseudonocardia sp. DSM 110487 TaxID=2865833 RepID=UPI001C69DE01|nr:CopD family protein [Pseudonocardia sp. DSM 110487]QYN41057.1 CopD family protein [Pseudonocardia sp. DSM 110487]
MMRSSRARLHPLSRVQTGRPFALWLADVGGPLGRWAGLVMLTAGAASVIAGGQGLAGMGLPIMRAAMDVAGVVFVGLALLGVLLPRDHRRAPSVLASTLRPGVTVAGIWLAAALLVLVFSAATAFDRSIATVGAAELLVWITRLGAGQGLLLTVAGATFVLVTATLRLHAPDRVPPRAVLAVALFAMITPTVTGHAAGAADFQVISVIGIGVHVAAAAVWVGGLGALLLLVAPHRGLLVATLPRFSRLAAASITAVTISGIVATLVRLPTDPHHGGPASWSALLESGWGLLLTGKVVALAGIGGLGWLTRRRMAASRMPLLLWAGHEMALMAVTLGLAAALTQTAPTT